jgi:hypothetical protein
MSNDWISAGTPFGSFGHALVADVILVSSLVVVELVVDVLVGFVSELLVELTCESSSDRDASHGFCGFCGLCGAHNALPTQ